VCITCCVTAEADNADEQYISRGAIYKIKDILLLFLQFIYVLLRSYQLLRNTVQGQYISCREYGMPHTWHLNPHVVLWCYHYSLHECLNEPTQTEITCCNNLHSYQVFINKMLLYYQSPLT